MGQKITHILDDLSIEEASLLLDSDFTFLLDKNIQNRIINSTKAKSGINNTNPSLHRFKNIFNLHPIRNKLMLSLASLFLFFGIGAGTYLYIQTPVTYVALDINPSVELALNKFNSVVSYNTYNIDGENILNASDCKHKKIDDAITKLIENAIEQEYIDDNKSFIISIATTINANSETSTLSEDLKYKIYNTLKDNSININYEVDIVTSTSVMSNRENANSMGMSFGKLNLIEELITLSPSLDIAEYKDKSVEYIQSKINELKSNKEDNISTGENLNTETSASNIDTSTSLSSQSNSNYIAIDFDSSNTNLSNSNNSNSSIVSDSTVSDDSTTSTNSPISSGNSSENSTGNNSSSSGGNNRPNHKPNKPNRPNKPGKPSKPGYGHWHDFDDDDDDKHSNKHNNKYN